MNLFYLLLFMRDWFVSISSEHVLLTSSPSTLGFNLRSTLKYTHCVPSLPKPGFLQPLLLASEGSPVCYICEYSTQVLTFFFLSFVFLGLHPWHIEVPRLGVQSELSRWPTPQPQQRGIQAAFSTYTTAHGNKGSLTH